MPDSAENYDRLEARFTAWAGARADIRLALVVGSRARSDRPADEWADLDVVMFTTAPDAYLSADWLAELGEVWAAYREQIRVGVVEWLTVLAGGLDLDVVVFPVEGASTVQAAQAARLDDVLARGFRPLIDRDGVLSQLPSDGPVSESPPDAATFHNTVQCFWRYAARTAKKLRRGELWVAKDLCDRLLKGVLLTMAGWHVRAADGSADTWYEGHFLEDWADPRLLAGLPGAFARYDAEDVWRALWATMNLFRWLATETAARLGYVYPIATDENITRWIEALYQERDENGRGDDAANR